MKLGCKVRSKPWWKSNSLNNVRMLNRSLPPWWPRPDRSFLAACPAL